MTSVQDNAALNQPHLVKPHLSGYLVGFIMAVFLTAVPFTAVAFGGWGGLDRSAVMTLTALFAAVQALVHMRYFLHWSNSRTPVEASIAAVFVAIVAAIMISGAMWVMSDLHTRMMP